MAPFSPRKSLLDMSMMSVEEEEQFRRASIAQAHAQAEQDEEEEKEALTGAAAAAAHKKRQAENMLRFQAKRVKLCETPGSSSSSKPPSTTSARPRREKKRDSDTTHPVVKRLTVLSKACDRAQLPALQQITHELTGLRVDHQGDFKLGQEIDAVLVRVSLRERDCGLAESFKSNGNTFFAAAMFDDAVRCYRQAYELDSTNPVHFSNCAAAYNCLGRYEDALTHGERAIKCDASFSRAYMRCAQALVGMGKLDLALERVRQVLCSATTTGAGVENSTGVDEAKEMERRILLLAGMISDAHTLLAITNYSAAWSKALECQAAAPNSVQIKLLEITSRMLTAVKTAQSSEAASLLQKQFVKEIDTQFAKTQPQEASVHLCALGKLMWANGLFSEAAQYFHLAKSWAPLDETVRKWWDLCAAVDGTVRRAKRYQDEHRFEDSLTSCGQALELTKEYAVLTAKILVMRANTLSLLHRYKEAEQDCARALELSPQCFKARLARAQIYLAQSFYYRLEEELRQVEAQFAHELKPSNLAEIATMRSTAARKRRADDAKAAAAAAAAAPKSARKDVPPTRSPPKSGKKENARPSANTSTSSSSSAKFPFKGTHYAVLGIDHRATAEEARKAYKKMALRFHPDKNSDPNAVECFKRIAEAADCLLSPSKRRVYDLTTM